MSDYSIPFYKHGFTLIELMAVVSILAITLAIAVPSMQTTIASTRLRTEASRLLSAINLARSESIGRNIPVSLCPSTFAEDGIAQCSGTFANGWIVFTNRNRDANIDAESDEVVRAFEGLPSGYTLSNKAGTKAAQDVISYFPDGSSRRNRTLMVCSPHGSKTLPWSIVMNMVGRPRLTRAWGKCQ